MTPKKLAGAVGGAALLTVAAAVAVLAPEGAECYAQRVQVPAEDYGGKLGELLTVEVERCLGADEKGQPLPAGWDAVSALEPIDDPDDRSKALAFAPPAKRGFPAVIPAHEGPDGRTSPARQVTCPQPPYVGGHEPPGCVEEWGRLQREKHGGRP